MWKRLTYCIEENTQDTRSKNLITYQCYYTQNDGLVLEHNSISQGTGEKVTSDFQGTTVGLEMKPMFENKLLLLDDIKRKTRALKQMKRPPNL